MASTTVVVRDWEDGGMGCLRRMEVLFGNIKEVLETDVGDTARECEYHKTIHFIGSTILGVRLYPQHHE